MEGDKEVCDLMLTTVMSNIATAVTAVTARGRRINGSEDAEDLMEISWWIFRHPSAFFGIFRHFLRAVGKIAARFCTGTFVSEIADIVFRRSPENQ